MSSLLSFRRRGARLDGFGVGFGLASNFVRCFHADAARQPQFPHCFADSIVLIVHCWG